MIIIISFFPSLLTFHCSFNGYLTNYIVPFLVYYIVIKMMTLDYTGTTVI